MTRAAANPDMPQRSVRMRRVVVIVSALYLAAIVGVFAEVLFTKSRVLSSDREDLATIFLHWEQFNARELGRGSFPLWNPHVYSGTPYFGAFQPALAYPPSWLCLVLPVSVAINCGIVLHFLIGALGTFLWAARRRLHPAACFVGGFVFTFCGAHFLQVYRGHLPNLRTLVWAPWILLAIDGVLASAPRTRTLLAWTLAGMAAVAMQILAGHVQETFYTALVAGSYALLCWARTTHRLRTAAALVAMYVGAAALAAVQLFAGLDAAAEGTHANLTYRFAASFAFPPENLLTLVFPGFFGDMGAAPYWGRWTLTEMSLFIGCAPFVLATYAIVAGDRKQRRFSVTVALLALVLACGSYTPLFRLLYDHVPGFASFRGTTKFTFLAMLFVSMLAAIGFDLLLRARPTARWVGWTALAVGASLAVAGGVVLVSARSGGAGAWGRALAVLQLPDDAYGFRYYPQQRSADFAVRAGAQAARSVLVAAATFLALGALWLGAERRRFLVYGIAAIGCLELLVYARSMCPSFDADEHLRAAKQIADFMRAHGDDARTGNVPYFGMTAGTRDMWGDDPMILRRYAEFVAMTQNVSPDTPDVLAIHDLSPLFSFVRLRYLFERDGARVRPTATGFGELPRATLVSGWRVLPSRDQRLAALGETGFDPRTTVLLEHEPDPPPAVDGGSGSVVIQDLSTDAMDVRVDAPAAAILLLGENYSAGWHAVAADGSVQRTYTIMPADHFLQAIPLAAGAHHFRLEYQPRGYVWGRRVTFASLLAYVVAVAALYARRRMSTRRAPTSPVTPRPSASPRRRS